MTSRSRRLWTYGRVLIVPLLLWGLVIGSLREPVRDWLSSGEEQDRTILREWIEEARGNLPGMVEDYLERVDAVRDLPADERPEAELGLLRTREKIHEFLDTLATPPSKMYNGTLPLFPTIFRIDIVFEGDDPDPIVWDSQLPSNEGDHDELTHALNRRARVVIRHQLHAYDKRQSQEAQRTSRFRRLSVLAFASTALAVGWMVLLQRRERLQELQLVMEERRRQDAEQRHQQAERDLLQQRLAAQEYEQKMLEMKSQLYAGIGIMAGSYAHNIKNLLVRPNDLLRRCIESDGAAGDRTTMLLEVKQTLALVTERLQQILQTVRRDPTRAEMGRIDLRALLLNLDRAWRVMAWDRWKLQLTVEAGDAPLWIEGDLSHLQQTVENLLFNARDATFEMRAHLREEARRGTQSDADRKQALIAAAGWKGQVTIVARSEGGAILLEVRDNGIGMSDEVKRRCTETHFSTKRDDAGYEGNSTGMGLGLSFVQMVLENHKATLEILTAPREGTTFRVRFPASARSDGEA